MTSGLSLEKVNRTSTKETSGNRAVLNLDSKMISCHYHRYTTGCCWLEIMEYGLNGVRVYTNR